MGPFHTAVTMFAMGGKRTLCGAFDVCTLMDMVRGFRLLDGELMQEVSERSPLWMITDVRFGHLQNWPLHLRLERDDAAIEVVFANVVSFRAHDESEIIGHWQQRDEEKVPTGTVYELAESTYLEELAAGTAGIMGMPLKHYLVAGSDLCVEVIATTPPTISKSVLG